MSSSAKLANNYWACLADPDPPKVFVIPTLDPTNWILQGKELKAKKEAEAEIERQKGGDIMVAAEENSGKVLHPKNWMRIG